MPPTEVNTILNQTENGIFTNAFIQTNMENNSPDIINKGTYFQHLL